MEAVYLVLEITKLDAIHHKKLALIYAILDIETTGGKYNEEGITEIAIYRFDGHEVVDKFISLVNPEREIQPFVVNLTGINAKMLRNAPKFYEVAKRIVEITEDCIIVAHNAEFDYRILRTEFKRLGFPFKRKSLCTVELAQKLMPEQESFSLGKLTRALGIPVSDRHRANGDAMATVKLFKLLLEKDVDKDIIQQTIKANKAVRITDTHKTIIEELPSITGVYFIHNKKGRIIFVGKSRNIKHRISQHLTNTNAKSKKIQLEIEAVTYEATGNELIAALKELEAIKRLKPKYNQGRRYAKITHALQSFEDEKGYLNLKIDRLDKNENVISTFSNYQSAKSFVSRLVEHHGLCKNLVGLPDISFECNYADASCNGTCHLVEPPASYNVKVKESLDDKIIKNKTMVLVDKGRDVNERSAVLIKDGQLKGYGFVDLNHQINRLHILEALITPIPYNLNSQYLIESYLRQNKKLKILTL